MNKNYSTEVKLIPTRHIMEYYWPRDDRNQNIRVNQNGIVSNYFQAMIINMRRAQVDMIKYYMPTMNNECKARAKRTLRKLYEHIK